MKINNTAVKTKLYSSYRLSVKVAEPVIPPEQEITDEVYLDFHSCKSKSHTHESTTHRPVEEKTSGNKHREKKTSARNNPVTLTVMDDTIVENNSQLKEENKGKGSAKTPASKDKLKDIGDRSAFLTSKNRTKEIIVKTFIDNLRV